MPKSDAIRRYMFAAICATVAISGSGYGAAAEAPVVDAKAADEAAAGARFVDGRFSCRCEDETVETRFKLDSELPEVETPVPAWQFRRPSRFQLDSPKDRMRSGRFLGPDERIVPLDGDPLYGNWRFR